MTHYTHGMVPESALDGPVHGLVDNRRAALMLGVPLNTFKVWATRAKTAKTGIPTAMPEPVASMHGNVYRAEDIEEFGRQIALHARSPRSDQRSRGAYFTPDDASTLIVQWAIRSPDDVVLEPSVGNGQFAHVVNAYADSRAWSRPHLYACELDPETAANAISSGAVAAERLRVGDFLAATDLPMVDAVIGNPPYVRVRELPPALRRSAMRSADAALGSPMEPSGSAWMPFVAKATAQLRPGGRLAFVLPLDFTYVRYAQPLWRHLGRSFGSLTILRFRERVFKGILQNVLILLADARGGSTQQVNVLACDKLSDLPATVTGRGVPVALDDVVAGKRVFQHALLPQATRETLAALEPHSGRAGDRAKFNIGYVSGNKPFFHPDRETVRDFRLPSRSLLPTIASSRQVSRAALTTGSMDPEATLWLPDPRRLTEGERTYIAQGEHDSVDMAYKCRIRKPWYVVPGVRVPDVILTTFSDRPRLHVNDAGWMISNSVLGGYLRSGETARDFADSWYTPLTLLSIEIEVHSLGGGVMIAVPSEADGVKVLHRPDSLPPDRRALDTALAGGDTTAAYDAGAASIRRLVGDDGLAAVRDGAQTLRRWRRAKD